MAKEKTPSVKVELEREYMIPLRKYVHKVPKHRRAPRAIKEIKKFIAKHMKVEGRNTKKVKIDRWLNNEVWFKGIKKPPVKIKIKAKKLSTGIVNVELHEIPKVIQYKIAREKRKKEFSMKKKEEKQTKKATAQEARGIKKEETKTDKESDKDSKTEEKKKAEEKHEKLKDLEKERTRTVAKQKAKQEKHSVIKKTPKTTPVRKALKK